MGHVVLYRARCAFWWAAWEGARDKPAAECWAGAVDIRVEDGSVIRTLLIERDGNPEPMAVPAPAIVATQANLFQGRSVAVDVVFIAPDEDAPNGTTYENMCLGGKHRKLKKLFEILGHPL